MLTSNGRVRLVRVRWHAAQEGASTPIDGLLDRAERTFSRGVREMLCRLNLCSSSFDKTAENIGRLTPIEISGESVRKLVEEEGRAAASLVRRGRLDFGWSAAECRTEQRSTRVYLGCDGVKVPMVTDAEKRKRRDKIKEKRRRCGQKRRPLATAKPGADQAFKEFRVATAYDESQERRAVAVTSGDCEAAGRLVRSMAVRLRMDEADETIANIDGAPWIRSQLELHGAVQHIGLDYYHLKDYAQKTRREVYGEQSDAGRQWIDELTSALLERGVDAAWDGLVAWRKDLRGRRRQAADRLLGYVAERRDMIRYVEFRAQGWQIGSGPTEAQCKTTTLRLKGRGRRWDKPNAEAIMALAAIEASRLWDPWWATSDAQAA
ncbi:MAG: hypothetical protein LC742_10175 [Acidobacteria bacterium]|nr:hypothetical protein [Acidobacteriota bacterium]